MQSRLNALLTEFSPQMSCLTDERMSQHTTFRIGGPADVMMFPENEKMIANVLRFCHERVIPFHIVGNGSNLLVRDEGIRGVVMIIGKAMSQIELLDDITISAQAGASLGAVAKFACDHGLSGLEFAWGIPGNVGGALYMNAGAYGGEIKDVVLEAVHLDAQGNQHVFSPEEMQLAYRHSAYMQIEDCCITQVVFRLKKGDPAEIRAKMDELMQRRKEKQPLEYPSAGSTFKRPQGNFAAALIDQCGLKGLREGDAQVSEKHAGFVINRGAATCADVQQLICRIRQIVEEKTGYQLECEVKIL